VMVPELDRDGDMIGYEASGRTECHEVGGSLATFWVADDGAVLYRGVRHVSVGADQIALADIVPVVR
jgi:hypothetical protein